MRNFKLYISLLLLMAFGLVGCQDDFDSPPVIVPEATKKANITILEIKDKYWKDANNYIDTIHAKDDGSHYIISGRVISSDASGNIYKNLVIQDATAALAISINANSLYTTYRVGQEVVIDLNEMYIGKYANLQQLGFPDYSDQFGWQTTFMPLAFFQTHTELNGLPEVAKIDTITTEIGSLPTLPADIRKMQSQLIRLDNVHFTEGGKLPFADADKAGTRELVDDKGNTINLKNSNYATFKNDILPAGTGSVVAILSRFNETWQLLIRSTSDCIGFEVNKQGSKENPFTVAKAIELQGTARDGWVKGYIVGAVKSEVTAVKSSADIEWNAPTALDNTIIIGATPDTKDIKDALVVKLPVGSALRAQANLVDNARVYKAEIMISGALVATMGAPGISTLGTVKDFEIIEKSIPEALKADFETFNNGVATSSFINATSQKGWKANYCSILSGWDSDTNPKYLFIGKVPGSDEWAIAPNMTGKIGANSSIVSPVIPNGCGVLTFSYGTAFTETNGIDFKVVIKQNGAEVKTIKVNDTKAIKLTKYTKALEVNVKGDFTVEFIPNSPSNISDQNKDRVCVFNVSWTENK